jgi:hypothetical protein
MTQSAPPGGSNAPQYSCGPLTPQQNDQQIPMDTQPQAVLAKIMLLCDDDTGVFFFRNNQNLYMRIISAG